MHYRARLLLCGSVKQIYSSVLSLASDLGLSHHPDHFSAGIEQFISVGLCGEVKGQI